MAESRAYRSDFERMLHLRARTFAPLTFCPGKRRHWWRTRGPIRRLFPASSSPSTDAVSRQMEPQCLQYHILKGWSGRGRDVARRPKTDERQPDFFGEPPPMPATPDTHHNRQARPKRDTKSQLSPQDSQSTPGTDSLDMRAARLSRVELNELAAALPDDALARLVIDAVRQLRRRLARSNRHAGKRRTSVLERAARQLAAELGGQGGDEDV